MGNPSRESDNTWLSGARLPLVEKCTNEWQNSPLYHEATSLETRSTAPDAVANILKTVWAVIKAPKFQRLVFASILATVLATCYWRYFLSDYMVLEKEAWTALNADFGRNHPNVYGKNMRVQFPGMTHLSTLDTKYLPRTSRANLRGASKHRRLIFVGDIHGCMDELQALLAKVKYNQDQDHIVALGDMINKGPKSREVVDFLMEHGASAVRGNHEDRILLLAKSLTGTSLAAQAGGQKEARTKAANKDRDERELAGSFSQEQLDWLNARPVILRVGDLGPLGDVVAVHGGLVPGIRLTEQDPMSVMTMRVINIWTHMPSQDHERKHSIPWAEFWNRYQKLIPAQRTYFGFRKPAIKHTTVVYGHDSKRGLQIDTYTKGLDSACVNGTKLTAWVVGDMAKEEIVQVDCKGRRSPK